MSGFRGFLGRHKVSVAMVAFVLLFYGALYATHRARHPAAPDGAASAQVAAPPARMTAEEVRQKEERFKESLGRHPRLFSFLSLLFLAGLSAGVATDGVLFVQRRRGVSILPRVSHGTVPWGLTEVARFFILLFFIESLVLGAEIALAALFRRPEPNHGFLVMFNSVVRDIVIVWLIVRTVTRGFGRRLDEIGLTARDFWGNVRTGLAAYLAIVPPLLGLLIVMAVLAQAFAYEPPPQPVVEIYLREKTGGMIVFFTFFVAVLGPVMEEIFFRGFAYKAFRTRYGVSRATLATAAIFSLLHASLIGLVPIFVLGIFLTILYERTGSLVPGIVAHMTHNLIMVSFTLLFKTLSA